MEHGPNRTAFATECRLTNEQLDLLLSTSNSEDAITYLELLRPTRFRSSFRSSLATQVRQWLDTGGHSRIHPLSPNQLAKARPSWPVRYSIPAKNQ